MKNLLLAAIAVGSFSLFSFKTVSDIKVTRNAENPNLYEVEYVQDVFTQYHREFPDKFVASRETWTKVDAVFKLQQLEASIKEIEELIEKL